LLYLVYMLSKCRASWVANIFANVRKHSKWHKRRYQWPEERWFAKKPEIKISWPCPFKGNARRLILLFPTTSFLRTT
jgi:ADP-heptose:LPS heptosyltransferase